jgi:hypothetical protein
MTTGLLVRFAATMGDFEFSCERESNGIVLWYKKLLNTPGAEPEQVCLKHVPSEVLNAFAQAQVAKQATQAQNQAA